MHMVTFIASAYLLTNLHWSTGCAVRYAKEKYMCKEHNIGLPEVLLLQSKSGCENITLQQRYVNTIYGVQIFPK